MKKFQYAAEFKAFVKKAEDITLQSDGKNVFVCVGGPMALSIPHASWAEFGAPLFGESTPAEGTYITMRGREMEISIAEEFEKGKNGTEQIKSTGFSLELAGEKTRIYASKGNPVLFSERLFPVKEFPESMLQNGSNDCAPAFFDYKNFSIIVCKIRVNNDDKLKAVHALCRSLFGEQKEEFCEPRGTEPAEELAEESAADENVRTDSTEKTLYLEVKNGKISLNEKPANADVFKFERNADLQAERAEKAGLIPDGFAALVVQRGSGWAVEIQKSEESKNEIAAPTAEAEPEGENPLQKWVYTNEEFSALKLKLKDEIRNGYPGCKVRIINGYRYRSMKIFIDGSATEKAAKDIVKKYLLDESDPTRDYFHENFNFQIFANEPAEEQATGTAPPPVEAPEPLQELEAAEPAAPANAYEERRAARIEGDRIRTKKALANSDRLVNAGAVALEGLPFGQPIHGAEIRRLRERITRLEKLKSNPPKGFDFPGGIAVCDAEQNRLRIRFEEAPPEIVRTALKSHGFHWSSQNKSWQRKITKSAFHDARKILLTEGRA
jgi:hypothetical protein